MRLAKPFLLIATPMGVLGGLYEAWKLAGGLALLMFAMVAVMGAAIGSVVLTVRRERREDEARQARANVAAEVGKPVD